jgi:hypothetical protein
LRTWRSGSSSRARSRGDVDAIALAIVTPGILGPEYFRDLAAVVDAAAGGPPDLAAIATVMRRHGLTPRAGLAGLTTHLRDG